MSDETRELPVEISETVDEAFRNVGHVIPFSSSKEDNHEPIKPKPGALAGFPSKIRAVENIPGEIEETLNSIHEVNNQLRTLEEEREDIHSLLSAEIASDKSLTNDTLRKASLKMRLSDHVAYQQNLDRQNQLNDQRSRLSSRLERIRAELNLHMVNILSFGHRSEGIAGTIQPYDPAQTIIDELGKSIALQESFRRALGLGLSNV